MSQVSILSVDVPADSPIAGVEVVSGVRMHNPSVASVQMGNVVLGLSIDVNPSASASASPVTLSLGEMTVPDLTLHPGDNEVTSTGYLFPTIVQASPVPVFSSSSSTLQLRTPADPVALTYAGPFFSRYLANITQVVSSLLNLNLNFLRKFILLSFHFLLLFTSRCVCAAFAPRIRRRRQWPMCRLGFRRLSLPSMWK